MVEIVLAVAAEVAKCLVAPIRRQFGYFCNYKSNFESLKREVEKLTDAKESLQHTIDDAKRKGEEVEQAVESWLITVEKIIDEAQKIIEDGENTKDKCLKGLCPVLKIYQLSKKAVREVKSISELREDGKFNKVSHRTIPEEIWLTSFKDYEVFESRMSTLRDIREALSNRNVNMIGVYGMGGIGKTSLVKEVARQTKKENLFDQVVFADVSQTPKINKIQGQIADSLGLQFSEESEPGRARRLCDRLRKEKKILIILDDIWRRIDLETVGIPFGDDHKGCKILLIARSQDVLSSKMDSQNNFLVGFLNETEAWRLFKKMAGDYIENRDLQSVAIDVAKACAGLPLNIVTVARALRGKSLFEWRNALRQLTRPSPRNFTDLPGPTYSSIEVSYNYLESEELRSTFLLIGYTYISGFLDLLKYGIGLGLFHGISTMEEARDRIHTLVRKLKESCLLLDDYGSEDFSIHDVVANVAISLASRDHNLFSFTNGIVPRDWPDMDTLKDAVSLVIDNDNFNELPQGLVCPQLKLFSLYNRNEFLKIPDDSFTSMKELRVLHLTGMHLSRLPTSLHLLLNLRTLCLDYCRLRDIAIIGNLKKLEILSFLKADIKELPREIGQLTKLRLLDLTNCFKLKVIPPNVISSLSALEELYMGDTSIQWEIEGLDVERSNASLDELMHLSNLTALEIYIKDAKILPKGLLSKKLERYKIFIGDARNWFVKCQTSRTLKLKLNSSICWEELQGVKNVEDLSIDEWHGENVLYALDREGFVELKHLHVQNNAYFLCIIDSIEPVSRDPFPLLESLILNNLINLEKICHSQFTAQSFCKLRIMNVRKCEKLKNIFSFSVARFLPQLQTMKVIKCKNMEEIFSIGREDDMNNELTDKIEFEQLRFLTLKVLPQFKSFYSKVKTPSTSQNVHRECTTGAISSEIFVEDEIDTLTSLFNEKVVFPNLEALELSAINFQMIWLNQLPSMSYRVQNLTRLIVQECDKLRYIFSSSMVGNFVLLQHLEICHCKVLEEIVMKEEAEVADRFVFPRLTSLKLCDLPELTTFYSGIEISKWPELKKIEVYGCEKVVIFTSELFSFQEPDEEGQLDAPPKQALFVVEKVFPNLEELALNRKNIMMISQLPENLFLKLKVVEVVDDESDVFPLSLLQKFINLEKFSLNDCSYTEISPCEEAGNITQLKYLTIKECVDLLDLEPFSTCFQNLTTLEVCFCGMSMKLVTSSTAKSLVQLKEMDIYDCGMEEIVVDDGDVEDDEIVFIKLKRLSLGRLYDLTSFSSSNHTFKFPSLKYLTVTKCPKMETFTKGVISTPKLLIYELDRTIYWEVDLNATIQQLHEKMISRSGMKRSLIHRCLRRAMRRKMKRAAPRMMMIRNWQRR